MDKFRDRFKAASILSTLIFTGWLWSHKNQTPQPARKTKSDTLAYTQLTQHPHNPPAKLIETTQALASPPEILEINRKFQILDEIFSTKNDNDPRLDTQFKNLTPLEKQAIRERYNRIKLENRNERGTLVFLLSRNLESKQDFDFLQTVVSEPRCNSLQDCSQKVKHEDGSGEIPITLEYPQIVAIKALEAYLAENPPTPNTAKILNEAIQSQNPLTRELAQKLRQKYGEQAPA